jgi:hypothetical protein
MQCNAENECGNCVEICSPSETPSEVFLKNKTFLSDIEFLYFDMFEEKGSN